MEYFHIQWMELTKAFFLGLKLNLKSVRWMRNNESSYT